jgi:hypothetical protein
MDSALAEALAGSFPAVVRKALEEGMPSKAAFEKYGIP